MDWSTLSLSLLLLSYIGGSFCKNVAVIGVMTEFHTGPDCKRINPQSVKFLEAVYWLIDNLPQASVQNVKFEIETRDICKHLSAVPATLGLINKYKNGTKTLIGIVTIMSSEKSVMVSRFINSLPEKYHIIQVGVAQTAVELNNRAKYNDFFRILPDDRTQMKMICDVLVQMKWNYLALLYENDVYGKQGAEIFTKCAKEANIHIAVKLEINDNNPLDRLKYDYRKVSGVVIIAQHSTVERLFENNLGREMSLFMTESVNVDNDSFRIQISGAFLVVQRAYFNNPKFEHHWRDLFQQPPRNTISNPYFAEMIEEVSKCSFNEANNSCEMNKTFGLIATKISKFETTESIAIGVYSMASVFQGILGKPCSSPNGCPGLFEQGLQGFRRPINFTFLKDKLGYERMDFEGTFDENGTLNHPPSWIFYQLFYRKKNKHSGKYSFAEAGEYTATGLNLHTVTIPGYDGDTEYQVESVTCRVGVNCKERQKTPDYIYQEGDIIFVGIIPIHDRHKSDPNSCGTIRPVSGISLAEAMLFAVKELNERRTYKTILPGKKIGILILDSCDSEIIILKKLFAIRRNNPNICGKHLNCSHIVNGAMVYIGALSSRVSHAVSRIMTSQHTVQISYGSTSDALSDRITYPNFMRICTSDDQQVKAFIDLLVKFSWKYVSIIYANEMYGISFKDSFLAKTNVNGICVIRVLPYDAKADLDKILLSLRQRPDAKVVILYLRSNQVQPFLNGAIKSMTKNEFIFIGSEAWADKIHLGEAANKIHGSITLGLEIQENLDFNRYTKERILRENMNIWLQNFVERKCYLPLSLDKRSNRACPQNYTLEKAGMKSTWIPFIIDALTAAAIGLNKSISELCENGIVCPELFKETNQVIENIKNVKLRKSNSDFKVFDDNGDGTASYNIFKIRMDGTYVKVGQWSNISSISFNKDFKQPSWTTECPNKIRCSECIYPHVQPLRKMVAERSSTAVRAIFFVLLLVLIVLISFIIYDIYKNRKSSKNMNTERENRDPYTQPKTFESSDIDDTLPKRVEDDPQPYLDLQQEGNATAVRYAPMGVVGPFKEEYISAGEDDTDVKIIAEQPEPTSDKNRSIPHLSEDHCKVLSNVRASGPTATGSRHGHDGSLKSHRPADESFSRAYRDSTDRVFSEDVIPEVKTLAQELCLDLDHDSSMRTPCPPPECRDSIKEFYHRHRLYVPYMDSLIQSLESRFGESC